MCCHIEGLPWRTIPLLAWLYLMLSLYLQFAFTFCFSSKKFTAVAFLSILPFLYVVSVLCSIEYVKGLIYGKLCGIV